MNIYNALIYKKLYGGGGGGEIEVESLTATENKTYNAGEGKAYNPVVVAIPEPTLISKSITANGNYSASADNADGYSSVSVNVPLPSNAYLLKSIEHEQVATFSDGTDNFLKSLEVAIEPVQSGSGDPTPTNIRPISGWDEVNVTRTGENLWGGEKLADDIVAKVPNATKDTTNKTVTYEASNIKDVILFDKFKPNTQYSFLLSTESFYTNITIIYTDGTWQPTISNQICVSDASKTVARLVGIHSLGTTVLKYDECGVFEGVITAQDFEPYNGHTYTIDLDGTRYGGTLDVVNGVLTVDRAYVDMGTLNWGKSSLEATILFIAISDKKEMSPMMCSKYQYVRDKGFGLDFGTISDSSNTSYIDYIFVRNQDFSGKTTTECASILNGTQLVYELATPTTIQLTPTIIKSLQGENNFFASTGEIERMQYWSKEVTS